MSNDRVGGGHPNILMGLLLRQDSLIVIIEKMYARKKNLAWTYKVIVNYFIYELLAIVKTLETSNFLNCYLFSPHCWCIIRWQIYSDLVS